MFSSRGHGEHKVPKMLGVFPNQPLQGVCCLFLTLQGYKLKQRLQSEDNGAAIAINSFTRPNFRIYHKSYEAYYTIAKEWKQLEWLSMRDSLNKL